MFNKPRQEAAISGRVLSDISQNMSYTIRYPSRRQFTTLPILGKQMSAGKISSMSGSLNFSSNIDASKESKAFEFRFVNRQATDSEIDSQPLTTVSNKGIFQRERLKTGVPGSYKMSEIAYWYKTKFGKPLSTKMRREEMVAEFEAQLKAIRK